MYIYIDRLPQLLLAPRLLLLAPRLLLLAPRLLLLAPRHGVALLIEHGLQYIIQIPRQIPLPRFFTPLDESIQIYFPHGHALKQIRFVSTQLLD